GAHCTGSNRTEVRADGSKARSFNALRRDRRRRASNLPRARLGLTAGGFFQHWADHEHVAVAATQGTELAEHYARSAGPARCDTECPRTPVRSQSGTASANLIVRLLVVGACAHHSTVTVQPLDIHVHVAAVRTRVRTGAVALPSDHARRVGVQGRHSAGVTT